MKQPFRTYADMHLHSLASQHAYSTLAELCDAAKEKGLTAIALTDHGPSMPDGAISHHFFCLTGLPDEIEGLHFFRGAEVNILDFNGKLDMDSSLLQRLDVVVASYHIECIQPSSIEDHTRGLVAAAKNPDPERGTEADQHQRNHNACGKADQPFCKSDQLISSVRASIFRFPPANPIRRGRPPSRCQWR